MSTGVVRASSSAPPRVDAAAVPGPTVSPPLALVVALCDALHDRGIGYCHWKSNVEIDRSASGENDLDLLVDRGDADRFGQLLHELGFKAARPSRARDVPGLLDHYGFDEESGRLVHLQAHYQLVLGDDMTKSVRLPIEQAYLASSRRYGLFALPAPELELVVLVVRLVLKHATADAQLCLQGRLSASERRELDSLLGRVPRPILDATVAAHLPFVPPELFDRCLAALAPDAAPGERAATAVRLEHRLAAHTRRRRGPDVALKVARRAGRATTRHVLRRPARRRPTLGGLVIAVVGGDGAGKSTVVEELVAWLGSAFPVARFHLGKPPRSLGSRLVRNAMRAARLARLFPSTRLPAAATRSGLVASPGRAWLVWHALNARDRRRAYTRLLRHATNGGIAVCDRYPLAELELMDGCRTRALDVGAALDRSSRWLVRFEQRCYADISAPDLLLVLKVDPDVAVARRPEQEPGFVRPRAAEVAAVAWEQTSAVVVDANRSAAEVRADVRRTVWSHL